MTSILIRDSPQSHVCVIQTVLDLLDKGYDVHVLADGVSSANKEEVPIALATMRQAGARITTSESCSFQLMGKCSFTSSLFSVADFLRVTGEASGPKFKAFSAVIKDELNGTRASLSKLVPYKSAL